MLTVRCYPVGMTDEQRRQGEEAEMTEFGRAVWSVIQERGAFSRAKIARRIGQETGWEPSRQAISNWLNGDREVPRDFVPAVIKTFGLSKEEAVRLEYLYFYGQGGQAGEAWRRAQEAAEQDDYEPEDKDP